MPRQRDWRTEVPGDLTPGASGHVEAHNDVHQVLHELRERLAAAEARLDALDGGT